MKFLVINYNLCIVIVNNKCITNTSYLDNDIDIKQDDFRNIVISVPRNDLINRFGREKTVPRTKITCQYLD